MQRCEQDLDISLSANSTFFQEVKF